MEQNRVRKSEREVARDRETAFISPFSEPYKHKYGVMAGSMQEPQGKSANRHQEETKMRCDRFNKNKNQPK